MSQGLSDMRLLKWLWGYVHAGRWQCFGMLTLVLMSSLMVVVPPYLIRQLLDVAASSKSSTLLQWLSLLYGLVVIGEFALGYAAETALGMLGLRATAQLREAVFAHLLKINQTFLDKTPTGRIQTRVISDVDALIEVFNSGSITIVSDGLTALMVVLAMLWLNVSMALVVLLVLPLLIVLVARLQIDARRAFRSIRKQTGLLNGFLAEHIAGMEVVQLFGQQQRAQQAFGGLSETFRNSNRRAIFFDAALFSLVEAFGSWMVAILLLVHSSESLGNLQHSGVLVAFIHYTRRLFVPLRDVASKYTVLQSALSSAERVHAFMQETAEPIDWYKPVNTVVFARDIVFHNVYFGYPDAPLVLKNFNLRIERYEKIGIVGATGSGKSTVLRLLSRLYAPSAGSITIDDEPIQHIDLLALRQFLVLVAQDTQFLSTSLQQNLMLSPCVGARDVDEATKLLGIDKFIDPKTWHLPAGETIATLSVGQKQLLSLARALACNPRVLLLDEATSHIDAQTEAHLQRALDVILPQRTAVVIAHRLATIEKMDRIVVLEQGRMVEQGSHHTLMRNGGLYKKMRDHQDFGLEKFKVFG